MGTPRQEVKTASGWAARQPNKITLIFLVCLRRPKWSKLRWRGKKHQKIVTMTQKRRLHQTLPIGKRLKATKPKPKHYDCPEGYASVETIKGRTRVRVLLDSGTNIFLININLVKNLHIPYETRQTALPILTFEGTNASYG